jgi:hypothetical protein
MMVKVSPACWTEACGLSTKTVGATASWTATTTASRGLPGTFAAGRGTYRFIARYAGNTTYAPSKRTLSFKL